MNAWYGRGPVHSTKHVLFLLNLEGHTLMLVARDGGLMAGFPATEAKLPMRRSSRMASRCCIDFLSSKNACTSVLSLSAAAAACSSVRHLSW